VGADFILFQSGQEGFERGKPAKAETVTQIERLEGSQPGQRGEIAAELITSEEIERL
jgi:hypothetical protein